MGKMAIPYIIREARAADGEQLRQLALELASEPGIMIGYSVDEVRSAQMYSDIADHHAQSDNSLLLVVEADEKIVATLNCSGGERKICRHVATLGISIKAPFRRQGLGTKLIQRAYNWASDSGIIKRIELIVFRNNVGAIKLYKKFGFEVEGIKKKASLYKEDYVDDVIMALLL